MDNSCKQHAKRTNLLSFLCSLAIALSFSLVTASHPYVASAMTLKASKTNSVPKASPAKITSVKHAVDPHFTSKSPTNAMSLNWAGYVATGGPATFLRARVTFTIPTITSKPDPNGVVSLWAGVGGATSNLVGSLVQAGIDSALEPADKFSPKPYQVNEAWIEAFPQDTQILTFANPKSLSTGDSVTVEVKAEINKKNHNVSLSFTITDNTTKESQKFSISTTDATFQTDGASGECIVERPFSLITNNFFILPQFGTAKLSGCQVSKANNATELASIGASTKLFRTDMANNAGSIIASTGPLSGNEDFTVRRVGDHK